LRYAALGFAVPVLLSAASGLRGTVVDPTGAVVVGSDVAVVAKPESMAVRSTTVDATGHFRIDGLNAGEYALKISQQGFETRVIGPFRLSEGEVLDFGSVMLKLGPVPNCTHLPTVASRPAKHASLEGRVIEPDSKDVVSGARVRLSDGRGRIRTAFTDERGAFKFSNPTAGRYRLQVSRRGYRDFIVNEVEIRAGQASMFEDSLELVHCPKGDECSPNREVGTTAICL